MKLIKFLTLSILGVALNQGLMAQEPVVHYGPTIITNQNIDNLTVYGPTAISGSTIKTATFKGPVKASQTSFDTLHIDGMAKFSDVKVANELVINGLFKAENSNLNAISIAAYKLKLNNTKVNKITVRIDDEDPDPQVVALSNGSRVDTLIFEAKNGKVILGDTSSSVQKLEGGQIVPKN